MECQVGVSSSVQSFESVKEATQTETVKNNDPQELEMLSFSPFKDVCAEQRSQSSPGHCVEPGAAKTWLRPSPDTKYNDIHSADILCRDEGSQVGASQAGARRQTAPGVVGIRWISMATAEVPDPSLDAPSDASLDARGPTEETSTASIWLAKPTDNHLKTDPEANGSVDSYAQNIPHPAALAAHAEDETTSSAGPRRRSIFNLCRIPRRALKTKHERAFDAVLEPEHTAAVQQREEASPLIPICSARSDAPAARPVHTGASTIADDDACSTCSDTGSVMSRALRASSRSARVTFADALPLASGERVSAASTATRDCGADFERYLIPSFNGEGPPCEGRVTGFSVAMAEEGGHYVEEPWLPGHMPGELGHLESVLPGATVLLQGKAAVGEMSVGAAARGAAGLLRRLGSTMRLARDEKDAIRAALREEDAHRAALPAPAHKAHFWIAMERACQHVAQASIHSVRDDVLNKIRRSFGWAAGRA
eukprot:jgi/Ulvmu1/9324/UM050_0074.1